MKRAIIVLLFLLSASPVFSSEQFGKSVVKVAPIKAESSGGVEWQELRGLIENVLEKEDPDLVVTPEFSLQYQYKKNPVKVICNKGFCTVESIGTEKSDELAQAIQEIAALAEKHRANIVLGTVAELEPKENYEEFSLDIIYNSQLIIDNSGRIIGKKRKTYTGTAWGSYELVGGTYKWASGCNFSNVKESECAKKAYDLALETVKVFSLTNKKNQEFTIFPIICGEKDNAEMLELVKDAEVDIVVNSEREGDIPYKYITENIQKGEIDKVEEWWWLIERFFDPYIQLKIVKESSYLVTSEGGSGEAGIISLQKEPLKSLFIEDDYIVGEVVLGETLSYQENDFISPECETGNIAFNKYGLNRVLLEWDAEKISSKMCESLLVEGESGYFCDAVQFSIMLFKRTEELEEKANKIIDGLSEDKKRELTKIKDLNSFLEKIGLNPDVNVLLLKDNYSNQFKKDFDSVYNNIFYGGERISIKDWNFDGSPMAPAFYNVHLKGEPSFNGERFNFPSDLIVEFSLLNRLDSLDLKLGTKFSENLLLEVPFDAGLKKGERNYGSSLTGDSLPLNDSTIFSNPSGLIALLETKVGEEFKDTVNGIVLGLGRLDGFEKSHYLKFNPSLPSAFTLPLEKKGLEETYKLYYTIGHPGLKPMPSEYFGERNYLFKWQAMDATVFDSFPVERPKSNMKCKGWDYNINSAVLEVEPELGSFTALAFLPFDSSLHLLCSSHQVLVDLNSYDGNKFERRKGIGVSKNKLLKTLLSPKPWTGEFSLRDAIEEVEEENMCVATGEDYFVLKWNKNAFGGKEEQEIIEAGYEEAGMNDLCRLYPGDVKNLTGREHSEDFARLYWCRPDSVCEREGGYNFWSKKKTHPCNDYKLDQKYLVEEGEFFGEDLQCCYKPLDPKAEERINKCLKEPMKVYSQYEFESPNAEFIEKILKAWDSPAIEQDDSEDYNIGEAFIHFNKSGWSLDFKDGSKFTKKKNFDPLVLLAFFSYESQMGIDPKYDQRRKSVGNIKKVSDLKNSKQFELCTNPASKFGSFCGYKEWWHSIRHWAWLIEANYVSEGKETMWDILYKYAPPEENDTEEYIETVRRRVCHWRELWREYRERKERISYADYATDTVVFNERVNVFFQPVTPTENDDLKCVVEVKNPKGKLDYTFIWRKNGQIFGAERKSEPRMKIGKQILEAGDVYECTVTVYEEGKKIGSMKTRASIGKEKVIEKGKGKESDKDNDGLPDKVDNCPEQGGPLGNQGCPPTHQTTCTKDSQCWGMDCSRKICFFSKKDAYGYCDKEKGRCVCKCMKTPPKPKENQVLFIFMPINWEGSHESFKEETSKQLKYFKEKSGLAHSEKCQDLEFIKEDLRKDIGRKCGIKITGRLDMAELLSNIFKCIKEKVGFNLNHRRTIFIGLTNHNPNPETEGVGFFVKIKEKDYVSAPASEEIYTKAPGLNIRVDPKRKYAQARVILSLASNVGSPPVGFELLSHEVGHTIGFCEQYSLISRIKQKIYYDRLGFGGCTNQYPGGYQAEFTGGELQLKSIFVNYKKCENELVTNCPEFVLIDQSDSTSLGLNSVDPTSLGSLSDSDNKVVRTQELIKKAKETGKRVKVKGLPRIDCLGRRFKENNKEARSIMGPLHVGKVAQSFPDIDFDLNPARSFDCFEKEQFIKQWCGG